MLGFNCDTGNIERQITSYLKAVSTAKAEEILQKTNKEIVNIIGKINSNVYERNEKNMKEEKEHKKDVPIFIPKNGDTKQIEIENIQIAISVGETFNIVDEDSVSYINLQMTSTIIEYIGEKYNLYKGSTYEESAKIDALFDNIGHFLIRDYTTKIEEQEIEEIEESSNIKASDIKLPSTTEEKIKSNIEAIKIAIMLESEKRNATSDEMRSLSKYVGFGGLSQIFEPTNNIKLEYIKKAKTELFDILTEKEIKSLSASTLNAHYTPSDIIAKMYEALEHINLSNKKLKILDQKTTSLIQNNVIRKYQNVLNIA